MAPSATPKTTRDGTPPERDELSVPQKTLIWFGLAVPADEAVEPARPRDRTRELLMTALVGAGMTSLVWSDRGTTMGLVAAVGFVILFGMEAARTPGSDGLAAFVVIPVGLAILLPTSVALWIPLVAGLLLASIIAVLAARVNRSPGDA